MPPTKQSSITRHPIKSIQCLWMVVGEATSILKCSYSQAPNINSFLKVIFNYSHGILI
jgi:hypothetical protein